MYVHVLYCNSLLCNIKPIHLDDGPDTKVFFMGVLFMNSSSRAVHCISIVSCYSNGIANAVSS